MTRTHAARRPGISILEVMTALFVAAVGMLSLLSLFPLGAVQMGQALRDARAAEAVAQADTHMRLWWQRDVVERPGAEDVAFHAMDNPSNTFDTGHPFGAAAFQLTATDPNPSYPVTVDPLGWQARGVGLGARCFRLAGNNPVGLIPRRSMQWITNLPAAQQTGFSFRTATLMDDLTFNEFGAPDLNASGQAANLVVREGRYNWLAVIQRPVNSNRHVADLKIAVFDGRAPGIAPLDAEQVFAPTGGIPAGTSQLILAGNADYLKAGSWIMDGTLAAPTLAAPQGVRNAIWYRVQALDRDTLPGNMIIDLQTPLLRPVSTASQIYTFKGLLEVFDRPQLAPPGYKKQSP